MCFVCGSLSLSLSLCGVVFCKEKDLFPRITALLSQKHPWPARARALCRTCLFCLFFLLATHFFSVQPISQSSAYFLSCHTHARTPCILCRQKNQRKSGRPPALAVLHHQDFLLPSLPIAWDLYHSKTPVFLTLNPSVSPLSLSLIYIRSQATSSKPCLSSFGALYKQKSSSKESLFFAFSDALEYP